MSRSLSGHAQVESFRTLAGKSSRLDPKLRAAMRRRIRAAAMVAAAASKQAVLDAPVKGTSGSTGLRQEIAAGIAVSLLTGNRAGVVIRSGANSQAHPRSVVKAFDKAKGWRHPAWGTDTWVQQQGHPYFASVISRYRDQVTRAVVAAMQEAGDTLK